MSEDETHRTRRWHKLERAGEIDPIQAMRMAIADIRANPTDQDARRHLRALAAEQNTWEQLALLLEDEARAAARRPEVQAAFLEELADVHENLDQPLETISAMEAVVELDPDNVEHHDRLAWLYRRAGAWQKAAEAFERVAGLARDDRARAALRAAGTLYRDNGRLEQAAAVYRAIVDRRPTDLDVWKALEETLTKLQRWRGVAEVRGEIAARATGVEKAVLLRGQARALEQAGDPAAAAALVAQASRHAPDNVSGLVDYADVLARGGQAREAAEIIAARVDEAIDRGAATDDVAALRLRLVAILDDDINDRAGATSVLRDLLAAAPEYLPGLERLASHAARAGDRRAHAEALMRYATAQPDPQSRLAMTIEAARRACEAGEHRAAVAALEKLTEELPHDRELAQELEEARTALVVDRALAEAAAGDPAAGERRLRTILGSRPYSPEAALALADLLAAQQRPDEAAEILRETLEAAPDHASLEHLAVLVKRTGELVTDRDEAHQLLHEAHRLDRKSLDITLALGESCFGRKLWREAALHLGGLAEHPDATKHAAAVAIGLVHAGLAEVRALRPANALRHYEAAVKLDPLCARAWHELAQVAMDNGETATAADRLEREAEATTEPRDRLRLYDGLGDLALEVLGDPARAERCWATVASIHLASPFGDGGEHVAMLHKLLVVQRRRGAGAERGETCAWLADLESDDGARKVFLEESIDAFTASGELRRARDLAASLVLRYPLDVNTVAVGSRAALAAGDADNSARWLRKALTTWDTNGDRGMGDPRRADLWRRLGDAERVRNNQAGALAAYQRAVATSADSDAALAARRGIVELASKTGRDESSSLIALVEAEQEPNDVIKVARQAADAGAIEDARAGFELARALGVALTTADERFLNANRPRPMASDEAYGASLDEAERRTIVDDEGDGVIGELLELIGEAIALICPDARTALERADLAGARRIAAGTSSATAALFPQIANALGGPQTLLYAVDSGQDLALLLSAPPVVVIGPRLAKLRATSQSDADMVVDAELRFRLGRVVELARARRLLAAGTGPAQFKRFVTGLFQAFGRAASDPDSSAITEGDRLKSAIPLLLRRRISERLAGVDLDQLDPAAYLAACERAADRSGMLACGDIGVAIAYSGGIPRARHLVRLAASPRYLTARKRLRSRANRSE